MLIISHKSSSGFKKFLYDNNFSFIETTDNPNLDLRIADHPDLSIFALDDNNIVIDKNVSSYYKELIKSKNIIDGKAASHNYPYDCIYNIYQYSNFYIHNDVTESHIEAYMESNSYTHLYTKQGYSRCSIIPMGDKILTSDYGIYKSLKDKINVILLKEEHIPLDGFPNGFIGGTCGLIGDTLIFNGNIENSPNYDLIKNEAIKSNLKLMYPDLPLVDLGSIIYLGGC